MGNNDNAITASNLKGMEHVHLRLQKFLDALNLPDQKFMKDKTEAFIRSAVDKEHYDLTTRNGPDLQKKLIEKLRLEYEPLLEEKNPDTGNNYKGDLQSMISVIERLQKKQPVARTEMETLRKFAQRMEFSANDHNDLPSMQADRGYRELLAQIKRSDAEFNAHPEIENKKFRQVQPPEYFAEKFIRLGWHEQADGRMHIEVTNHPNENLVLEELQSYMQSTAKTYGLASLKVEKVIIPPEADELPAYDISLDKSDHAKLQTFKPIIDVTKLRMAFDAINAELQKTSDAAKLKDSFTDVTFLQNARIASSTLKQLEQGKPITFEDAKMLKTIVGETSDYLGYSA